MYKIRYTKFLATALIASLMLSACTLGAVRNISGSGVIAEETREMSGISSVKFSTLGHLTITVGDTESLTIECEDNLFAYLLTEVDNGKLTIQSRPNLDIEPTKPLNFYLTVKALDRIEITSSGDIEASDLQAGQFSIKISSSGNLEMGELEAETLEVELRSSGNLDIAGGKVKTQNIKLTSSGNYNAENLESDEAEVKISSSGTVTIWVKNHLTADLSSDGEIRYQGNPKVDVSSDSSGGVIKIDD